MPAYKSAFIIIVLLWAISSPGRAVQMDDLYVAEVLVPANSQNPLPRGAREGLMDVLIRVSGTTAVANSETLRAALANANDYYYQYSFDATDETLDIDNEEAPARLLRIHFEPSAIASLLRRAGFPVWGSNRPSIMLWIAVDDGSGRRLISESDAGEFADALDKQAQRRGLPLLYPLLDIEDKTNLSPAAVWGFFLGRVVDASRRYSPDTILTGRVMRDDDGAWSAHWSWRIDQRWISIDNTAPDADALVAHVIDRLADDLVSRYAIGSARSQVWMRVEAVNSVTDYAGVSRYLAELMPVVDNQLVEVADGEVLFRVDIEGQSSKLVELIQLDKKMVLMNSRGPGEGTTLRYRWLN